MQLSTVPVHYNDFCEKLGSEALPRSREVEAIVDMIICTAGICTLTYNTLHVQSYTLSETTE